ncbi:MAG: type IV toxin-antitoxin system AbiEi family antitoxin domain-containing protein [Actinomycetota bacterium]
MTPVSPAERRCESLAGRQHGVIERAQARAAGMSERVIDLRLGSGMWRRLLPGVYCLKGTQLTWRLRLMAACLWARGIVSHRAAGLLWGMEGIDEGIVEISTSLRRRSPEAIVVHQVTDLPDVSTIRLQGFRVSDPTRTLIDLAGVVDSCTLAASLDSALRNRQSYPELLIRRIDELGSQGRKGIRTLRELAEERGERGPTDAPLEVQAERFLTRHGLEPPRLQYWVEGPNGDRRRLDFAWPELKVGVEVDSRTWHEEYSALERDAGRANFYLDAGWKVLRLTRRGMRDEGPSLAGKLRRIIGHSQLDLDRNADSPR